MDRSSQSELLVLTRMTPTHVLLGVKAWNSRPLNPACCRLALKNSCNSVSGGFPLLAAFVTLENMFWQPFIGWICDASAALHATKGSSCETPKFDVRRLVSVLCDYGGGYHNVPMNRD